MRKIESIHNPAIKQLLKLKTAACRREQGVFIVEGRREISLAVYAGIGIKELLICPELAGNKTVPTGINEDHATILTEAIFQKISHREHPDGFLALAEPKMHALASLTVSANPIIIILEAVEKPGNLGAILRTADAAGADAVIIADPQTDIYNPNVIRASQGTVFTVPVAIADSGSIMAWLTANNITAYATTPDAKEQYTRPDYTKPSAIVMGTEADGLTDEWLMHSRKVRIPMRGRIDSLNVSVATAIVVFEALRQRSRIS